MRDLLSNHIFYIANGINETNLLNIEFDEKKSSNFTDTVLKSHIYLSIEYYVCSDQSMINFSIMLLSVTYMTSLDIQPE